MWDNGNLSQGYSGTFESYEDLVKDGDPDIIYLNSVLANRGVDGTDQQQQVLDRVDWGLVHQRNLMDNSDFSEEDAILMGPKQEISRLNAKLEPETLTPTRQLESTDNRLDEYRELYKQLDGDEEIHFITDDYNVGHDQTLQHHTIPDIQAEFIGAKTQRNTSTEKIKRQLYAQALKFADRF